MSKESLNLVITRREDHTPDIAVLELASADGEALPRFEAGSHVDLRINDDLVRQYSLCNDPTEPGAYRLGILKDPASRGGSEFIHGEFKPGREVSISLPRNNFPLDYSAPHTVLIGGGIGITPMIAMAYALLAERKSFELHYCMRSLDSAAFLQELRQSFGDRVVLHPDDEPSAKLEPAELVTGRDPGTHLYVCGPTGFMDWVIHTAQEAGLADHRIHMEYFNADVDQSGAAFDVVAQASGVTVRVEEGVSIADALREAGVTVDVSCEQGVCGTCICDVLEGVPDHKDHFLNEEEKDMNDQMAVCCSRAKSDRLVLDL